MATSGSAAGPRAAWSPVPGPAEPQAAPRQVIVVRPQTQGSQASPQPLSPPASAGPIYVQPYSPLGASLPLSSTPGPSFIPVRRTSVASLGDEYVPVAKGRGPLRRQASITSSVVPEPLHSRPQSANAWDPLPPGLRAGAHLDNDVFTDSSRPHSRAGGNTHGKSTPLHHDYETDNNNTHDNNATTNSTSGPGRTTRIRVTSSTTGQNSGGSSSSNEGHGNTTNNHNNTTVNNGASNPVSQAASPRSLRKFDADPHADLERFASRRSSRAWIHSRAPSMQSLHSSASRIHVQDSHSGLFSHADTVSAQGVLPGFSSESLHARKPICMLLHLGVSVGVFCPRFRPEEFVHVLYVPQGTQRVVFLPSSHHGKVRVNHKGPHLPVELTGASTKVLISITPESEYMTEGCYTIDVRVGAPPPQSPDAADQRLAQRPELYRVFFDFVAENEVELSLHAGETVRVTNKANDWWFGCVSDRFGEPCSRFGYFPRSFLRPLIISEPHVHESDIAEEEEDEEDSEDSIVKTRTGGPLTTTASTMTTNERWLAKLRQEEQDDTNNKQFYIPVTRRSAWYLFATIMVCVNFLLLIIALQKGGVSPTENPMLGPTFSTLQSLGARWVHDILQGRVYLLLTELFLPVGIIRFLLDVVFYWFAVTLLERCCGSLRTGIIFFVSGVVGNITGSFFVTRWLITGSSSALFGCCGALLCLHVNRAAPFGALPISKVETGCILLAIAVAMVFGTLPGLENFSQVGGFLAGYLACMAFASDCLDHRPQLAREYALLGLLSLGALFVAVAVILFLAIDINTPCFWCMDATCIPAYDWCEAGRLGSGLVDYASF